ncbi:permease prefix domain 1-containing protein [Metabacillus idriensis]|uniref:permease prefix domain 1-containing protein n=1 Tax=Metabacillus idriensis TaxID=324768 RepID=UPI00174CD80F|nr:permease prefix domain 1-containing protein [Metabacillus idriensis]
MKQIDKYVNSIYKNVSGNKQEIEDLMEEMRSHLIESVEELKAKGKSEEEAIRIAIENFGGKQNMIKGLSEFFKVQKKFLNYIGAIAVFAFVLGCIFLISSIMDQKEFNEEAAQLNKVQEEQEVIMDDVFHVLEDSNDLTQADEKNLIKAYEKYQDKLNLIAVFPVKGLEDWLQENQQVLEEPDRHFPIDYLRAAAVIGKEGVIKNKEQIEPSDYDFGNVIMANSKWIVQYEYKTSYEKTIEKYVQLKYYGPTIWSFYQIPILYFTICIVLGVVWLFLKKQNKQLKEVIS